MLRKLQQILGDTGLDLGDEEILDVLWLASRLPQGSCAPLVSMLANGQETADPSDGALSTVGLDQSEGQDDWAANADSTRQRNSGPDRRDASELTSSARTTPLVGASRSEDNEDRGLLVPGLTALGGDLAFSRALRPLKRRTPSAHATEVAEVATAEAQADTGVAQVLLRPQLERWLRLALIIDNANSMLLWEQHCRELLAVFERSGAFRQITVHQLHHGTPSDPRSITLTRPWQTSAVPSLTPHAATDPSGRTMVIVLTDGAASAWRDGRMRALLQDWAAAGPTALVHVLPRQLWARTGVNADTWHVQTSRAGEPNANWRLSKPFVPPEYSQPPAVSIPVLELRPPSFASWAQALTNVGHPVPLRLWEPCDDPRPSATRLATSPQTFIRTATPQALRLAAHLAACSPLTVPVMQLVHSCLPGRHHGAALAEVFLSGQLTPLPSSSQRSDDLRHRFYDFSPEAKDLLMDAIPAVELITCSRRVGERMESLAGRSRDFPAWLLASFDQTPDDEVPHPFAHVGDSFLTRIGQSTKIGLKQTALDEPLTREQRPLIGIICSSSVELRLILDHLVDVKVVHTERHSDRLTSGRLPDTPWDVCITLAGPSGPSVTADSAILESMNLDALLILEVGSGITRNHDVGDIVIASRADQAFLDDSFNSASPQPSTWLPSLRLERAARRALDDHRVLFTPVVTAEKAALTPRSARTIFQAHSFAGSISMVGTSLIRIARKFPNLDVLLIQIPRDFGTIKVHERGAYRMESERAAASAIAVLRELSPRPTTTETLDEHPPDKTSTSNATRDSHLVAIIGAPSPPRAGSRISFLGNGVLVGSRLVLTAEHVARSGRFVAHPAIAKITAAELSDSRVLWSDTQLDAALLLLTDNPSRTEREASPPFHPWASLSLIEPLHSCVIDCILANEDGHRKLTQVHGSAIQVQTPIGAKYEFAPNLPLRKADTTGMSGAPVYFNGYLLGLVVAISDDQAEGIRFTISDIATLATSNDFAMICNSRRPDHTSLTPISTTISPESEQKFSSEVRITVDRSGAPSLHDKTLLLLRLNSEEQTSIRIQTDQNDVGDLQSLARRLEDDPSIRVRTRIVRNVEELGAAAEILALHVGTIGPIGLLTGAVTAWLMTRKSRSAVHLSTADGRMVTITGDQTEQARAVVKNLLDDN